MSRKLLFNSLSGTTLYAANVIVAFVMSPVYINALGNRDYGIWELVMSVIGYMGLLDLGIGPALMRFVSVADGKQDRGDLQQTMSTAFVFFIAVGAVAVLLFFILGYTPGLIVGEETKDIANLGTVFVLLGVNAGMLFPLQVFSATLMGVQRHYFINSVRLVVLIINASLNYYLLLRFPGHGLIILAMLTPFFTAIQFVLLVGAVYFDKKIPQISLSAVTRIKAKELVSFGAKSATMLIASRLQNQSAPLIIGHVLGLGHIVYFVMPNRLIVYAKGVSDAIGFPLASYFGAAVGREDQGELLGSWLSTTMALQIVSLAMPIGIFFCGESFLGLWLGQEYAVAGRMVLYVLATGLVADSLATNAFRMLTARGRHGSCALVWLCFSAISIPVGIVGAHLWGAAGVAVGITLTTVLANLITVRMVCIVMNIPLRTYFQKTTGRVLFPLVLLTITLWLLRCMYPVQGYPDLLLHIVVGGLIYLSSVWCFTLGADVRERLRRGLLAVSSG